MPGVVSTTPGRGAASLFSGGRKCFPAACLARLAPLKLPGQGFGHSNHVYAPDLSREYSQVRQSDSKTTDRDRSEAMTSTSTSTEYRVPAQ